MNNKKTRNQSVHTFFESLQLEYIVAVIRSKIYPSSFDRKYYKNRVMSGKRRKIEEISARNNLISIFESKELYDQYYNKIIPDWGFPNFIYTDEKNKNRQFNQDRINYFAEKTEVAIREEDGTISVGTVTSNRSVISKSVISIKRRGDSTIIVVPVDRARRIL